MIGCTIRQPPPPVMRRRLRMSRDRGWLLHLHLADCTRITGAVLHLDVPRLRCMLEDPAGLCPEREIDLDGVCEVQPVQLAMLHQDGPPARFVVVAPWRGGSADPASMVADLLSGSIADGEAGTVLLDDGSRRPGHAVAIAAPRYRIILGDAARNGPR